MVFEIGRDNRTNPAILYTQRPNIHPLATHAYAAVTQDAPWPVKINHRRPLLLLTMILDVNEFRFRGAVGKRHVLKFALAASVAYRTIKRMIAKQHLHHAFARLVDFVIVRGYRHPLGDHRRAGGLQLRHLLDPHQAHAASALQRQIGVITKRRDFDTRSLAGFDQKSSGRSRDLLAVNRDVGICHCVSLEV